VSSLCVPQLEVRVRKRIAGSICVLSVLLLAGCTVGPNISAPRPKFRQSIKKSAIGSLPAERREAQHQLVGDIQDPQLNALEARSTSPTKT